jgi:hypothetical protein
MGILKTPQERESLFPNLSRLDRKTHSLFVLGMRQKRPPGGDCQTSGSFCFKRKALPGKPGESFLHLFYHN